jgi:serine/threonine-protein kinase
LIHSAIGGDVARDILPAVQQALGDLFQVERELGRGGGARVFLARDQQGRQVALKVLHPELLVTVAAERFLREVRLAGKLDHPNIASLIDSGERDWVVYYTMQYVEGPTLRQALDRVRQLPVADAVEVGNQLLGALGHAHAHGIVHRDVKPENVIISRGRVMLVDFGIARAILASAHENLTRSGMALGTCTYMSPEQIRGERAIDHRADVYSMGSLLFECLVGRPPFQHKVEALVLQKVLTEAAPPVQSLRPDVPAGLAAAIERALRKEPEERWPTAEAMRDALAGTII